MKLQVIAMIVLFGGWSFLGAQTNEELMKQDPLPEGNDARFNELTEAFGLAL